MNVSLKKLFLMAASAVIGAAVIHPATLSAQTSGIGGDGYTRLLWRGTDSRISLWKLDPVLNAAGDHQYGPYAGWLPIAITVANNSYTYVLWRHTNGTVTVWAVDPNLNFAFNAVYGPYDGWVAESLSADTNGNSTLRLIWRYTTGAVSIWFLNPNLTGGGSRVYGPYFGFDPGAAGQAAVKSSTPGSADAAAAAVMKTPAGAKSMPK